MSNVEITNNIPFVQGTLNIEKAQEKAGISLPELCNDEFMKTHTKFTSFQELLNSFGAKEADSLENNPQFDSFISQNSEFKTFEELIQSAFAQRLANLFE